MARVTLTERERAGISFRMAGVNIQDTATRRRVDRVWDALKLDELPLDTVPKLNDPSTKWPEGSTEYPLTSEQRDNLIEWLTPTDRAPMNGFMGRVLGPVYDELKDARDGDAKKPPLAAVPEQKDEEKTS